MSMLREDTQRVLITARLRERPARAPDHAAENRALRALADSLARDPGGALKRLTDVALELCGAQSVGVSLLEMHEGSPVFRWHAVSGQFAQHEGGFLPRDQSPCGLVVDSGEAQLMASPEQVFPLLRGAAPAIREALLVPFQVLGETVGTLWILDHGDDRRFDTEDLRLVTNLAAIASVIYLMRTSLDAALETGEELRRANARLVRSNERLWRKLVDSGLDGGEPDRP